MTHDADSLTDDLDLSMQCVGLALAAAGALLEGDEAGEAVVGVLALWPEDVPDAGLVVGERVALLLARLYDLTPGQLGEAAKIALEVPDDNQEADA